MPECPRISITTRGDAPDERSKEAHPREMRERAVRLVVEHRADYSTEWEAIRSIAARCDVGAETLRKWLRRSEVDSGHGRVCLLMSTRRFVGLSVRMLN